MKAILFFVARGIALAVHKELATALSAATGQRVVFRNSSLARSTGENPEPCEGCAGDVPEAYAARFPTYDAEGNVSHPEGATGIDAAAPELNALGLPKGCPDNKADLKQALTDEGVEFHPNMKTEKLVDLFRAVVLPKLSPSTEEA